MGAGWGRVQIPWIRHTHIWTTYSQSKTRAGSVESHFIDMNREFTGKRYRTATRLWTVGGQDQHFQRSGHWLWEIEKKPREGDCVEFHQLQD